MIDNNDNDMSLWMHNTVTNRLLSQVQDEVSSINMTVIAGECKKGNYKYLCGRMAGLRVVEDFIMQRRSEGRGGNTDEVVEK